MTYKIEIVTYGGRALPAYQKLDDYLLKAALTRRGMDAIIFSWTNPQLESASFDALVLRSCWDAHLYTEYYAANHPAAAFYAAQGFVYDRTTEEVVEGQTISSIYVRLQLPR